MTGDPFTPRVRARKGDWCLQLGHVVDSVSQFRQAQERTWMLMRVQATFRNGLIKETLPPGEYGVAARGAPVSDWTTIRPISDPRANVAFSSATSTLARHETLHWPSYEQATRDLILLLWSADSDPETRYEKLACI